MKNYDDYYQKLSRPWRTKAGLLEQANQVCSGLVYTIYPASLGWLAYQEEWQLFLVQLLVPALGFGLVSLIRRVINQPRPYERWPIQPLLAKETIGQSFPSRHVFSASVIGTVLLVLSHWLGLFVMVLALFLAALRVLGGVHYPRDVIAGFLLGILLGLPVFFW